MRGKPLQVVHDAEGSLAIGSKDLRHSKHCVSASKKAKTVLNISVKNFICRKFREILYVCDAIV